MPCYSHEFCRSKYEGRISSLHAPSQSISLDKCHSRTLPKIIGVRFECETVDPESVPARIHDAAKRARDMRFTAGQKQSSEAEDPDPVDARDM
jgi:hypothetical protein